MRFYLSTMAKLMSPLFRLLEQSTVSWVAYKPQFTAHSSEGIQDERTLRTGIWWRPASSGPDGGKDGLFLSRASCSRGPHLHTLPTSCVLVGFSPLWQNIWTKLKRRSICFGWSLWRFLSTVIGSIALGPGCVEAEHDRDYVLERERTRGNVRRQDNKM